MAVASTKTKLPLTVWARYMGLNPLHFEQCVIPGIAPLCSDVYFQYEWQNSDHVSREEIARAILEAETKIERFLGYRLAPSWEVDEWRQTDGPFRGELYDLNVTNIRGQRQTAQANWGYFISGGIQSKSLVGNAAIVYSDALGNGYNQTATVSIATVATDPQEIAVFYPTKAGDDAWEIRPINVSIAAGIATITFKREQAVKAVNFELFDYTDTIVDYTDNTDFLTTVDVYRRYNDPQTQVSFLWEPLASNCGTCDGGGCPSCAYSTQTGCLMLRGEPRNSILGYVPANWNGTSFQFDSIGWDVNHQPDLVRLFYYAGWRDKSARYLNRMAPEMERIVAHMSAALLDRPPCDCSADVWMRYREDLTLLQGDENSKAFYRDPTGILDNPFGSRRGEVDAWRFVTRVNTDGAALGHAIHI